MCVRYGRDAVLTVTLALSVAGLGLAQAAGPGVAVRPAEPPGEAVHVLRSGETVSLPEIAGLDCSEMAEVLAALDRTDYRGRAILPPEHPDYPVFVYEDRLASEIYLRCMVRPREAPVPENVFSGGFEPD